MGIEIRGEAALDFQEPVRQLSRLDRGEIRVGWQEGESPEEAVQAVEIYEFGLRLEISQSLRDLFQSLGRPLDAGQQYIEIPEISLSGHVAEDQRSLQSMTKKMEEPLVRLINGEGSAKEVVEALGEKGVALLKRRVAEALDEDLDPVAVIVQEISGVLLTKSDLIDAITREREV